MTFENLGLTPELLRAVSDQGYTEPTPVQAQAIPLILQGRDVLAGAQTGTGKTAGFTLPLLQLLSPHANTSTSPARHPVKALILAPTRELALQVEESVRTYGKHLQLRSTIVYGGVNINPQITALRKGVEILVATPGRLLDHVQQKTVNLGQVQILVLDEADRMLDMGFLPDIKRILALLPRARQNLLFSATFSNEIKKLADSLLNSPVLVEVARRNQAAELVSHMVHVVERENKRDLLAHLVKSQDLKQVLVFVATRHGANRLAQQLARAGIKATAIHSDKSQPQRIQALADFKSGAVRVLCATDVAARGLDIEELPHVVNFDLPRNPEDYVHRIGRTGRAGSTGDAISLVAPGEMDLLKDIERFLKRSLPREEVSGFVAPAHAEERAPHRKEHRPAYAGRKNGQEHPRMHEGARARHSGKPAHAANAHAPAHQPRPAGHHAHGSRTAAPHTHESRPAAHHVHESRPAAHRAQESKPAAPHAHESKPAAHHTHESRPGAHHTHESRPAAHHAHESRTAAPHAHESKPAAPSAQQSNPASPPDFDAPRYGQRPAKPVPALLGGVPRKP